MTLYLGLDPSRYPFEVTHYPVIRTEKIVSEELVKAFQSWPDFTHVIFTSRTAVSYWFEEYPLLKNDSKVWIAVGASTGAGLKSLGIDPLVAREETQEGVISLLSTLDLKKSFVFMPRSKKSRPKIIDYLHLQNTRYLSLDLYDTFPQKKMPAPLLENFEKIVFTSPSTVYAFLEIYGSLPKDKCLIAIGPVTQKTLDLF